MAKRLSGTWLLDTNILVAFLDSSSVKHEAAVGLMENVESRQIQGVVSSQNVLELSSVLIGGYKGSRGKVVGDLEELLGSPLNLICPNNKTVGLFLEFLRRDQTVHITDIFLAAIMVANGVDSIITNDKSFEKIKGMKVYNPFRGN